MVNGTYTSELVNKDKLCKEDVLFLLSSECDVDVLMKKADAVRSSVLGDEVFIRGIIEFSNYCRNDCNYCGIRKSNSKVGRYRMDPEQIIDIAVSAVAKFGYKTILLQSGEDDYYTDEIIVKIVEGVLSKADCRIALSIGERPVDSYKRFYEVGARRVLIRFETSNPELYAGLHSGNPLAKNLFDERVALLNALHDIGYKIGSGMMVGLPGQTDEDLVDDIFFMRDNGVSMAGMGPFISHPDTPMAGNSGGEFWKMIKVIAIVRLVCPEMFIPSTTALQTIRPVDGRQIALKAGANLLMPNVTPQKYRQKYLLYPDKVCIHESADDCAGCVRGVVSSVGLTLGEGYGDPIL
ncbi:[FeFe] hydrogenase H-cluster radical SAM maturase HydE [Candidatus Woesearchaeota archaeon]|jgi:biotin synthase|nr:[FeFe] hydrogenase H-cluster radical SAM maturase HydE [Candidatus Woesearchaeota archaeon]MBT3537213.1 [FeFe] hydrogenase H-cluster radical SAM maturase HydE [Candidatus Woesearchaeota archaeon]MBT4698200.1 [FeFe] hydrogenase H-cluster radical SAM maturase HydE [Candidatus Woesearchaeota archaeon]MBT4717755.1 [FeFe] hydrogenase H-cluster radical SAM maturase HydE [Candidatus Woesearchaeota archaeon]MBT7106477.1 [FeFe] hydrogenase H-cluster radical SAM maturase HydE [Candidatus Woesearchaeot